MRWGMYSLFCIDGHCCVESRRRERYDFDTIRSLHLAPCALYVGTVKRENIGFDITAMTIEEGETYDKAKQRTVAARVEDFLDGHKTIIIILCRRYRYETEDLGVSG